MEDTQLQRGLEQVTGRVAEVPAAGSRAGKFSGRGRDPQEDRKKKQMIITISICAAAVVLLVALIAGIMLSGGGDDEYVDDGKILKNVMVAGINIGGMTKEEAARKLHQETDHTFSQQDMVIVFPTEELRLTPQQTGAKLDVDAVVEVAYAYGRTGTPEEQKAIREQAKSKPYHIALLQYLNLDREYIRNTINEYAKEHVSTLQDPVVSISGNRPAMDADQKDEEGNPTVEVEHQVIHVTVGTPDFVMDPAAVFAMVQDAYSSNQLKVTPDCSIISPIVVTAQELFDEFCKAAVDAYRDPVTFETTKEERGYGFDIDAVQALLDAAPYGATLDIPLGYLEPTITLEELDMEVFLDILGSAQSKLPADSAKLQNVTKALEVINGLVVNPGETFSFNRKTGEPTSAKGYAAATIFKKVGGSLKEAQVMGGGMSQVSSALYAAVLLADLEVVSRTGHLCVPEFLTQLGVDADVRYGEVDFSFRNNSEKPVRINAVIYEDQLIVSLEGTETRDYTVELETEIVETKEYNTLEYGMDKNNPMGYKDGDVMWNGFNGYTVEVYRCKYDAATGILVSRSIETNTSYQKRDAMVVRIESEVPPTEPSVDVTEPSVDVTEPSVDTTEPSSEPTENAEE